MSLDKWIIYDHPEVAWDPHEGQLEVVENYSRHRVVAAGRRFGKSDLGGHELLVECFKAMFRKEELRKSRHRMEYWIVGPEYSDAEKEFRVLWYLMKALQIPMDHSGPNRSYYDPLGGNMHISCWDGLFQVHAKSAKYPDTLVGEGLSGVVLAEAAKLKEIVWTKYVRPTLADFDGWSLHTSTPEGKNHFYEKWKMGQDPANKAWASWKRPAWLNPYVYKTPTLDVDVKKMFEIRDRMPGTSLFTIVEDNELTVDSEIVDLANDMTTPSFQQEIGADFTEFVGQVFKDWDEEYHVGDIEFNPDWDTFAACDYGYTNPSVWLLIQVGPWQEINVVDEIYESYLTPEGFANEIRRRRLNPPQLHHFYPDPARPDSTRSLEESLRIRGMGDTGGDLPTRLDLIRKVLRTARLTPNIPPGHPDSYRPQLMFSRKCVQSHREMAAYRYREFKEGTETSRDQYELPLKKDDHVPEALGRFMRGYFGQDYLVGEGSHAVVRRGKASSRSKVRSAGRKPEFANRLRMNEPEGYEYKEMGPRPQARAGVAPEVITISYDD